jgi:hypothetical protein
MTRALTGRINRMSKNMKIESTKYVSLRASDLVLARV